MSYVDELAHDDEQTIVVDKAHVQRRVDDWMARLEALYGAICTWADQAGWTYGRGAPVPMHEDMMQRAGIPPQDQASLILTSPAGVRVWFKPKGLWVIGANGRIDVYTLKDLLLLVDTAYQFEPPQWIVHRLPSGIVEGQVFSPTMLSQLGRCHAAGCRHQSRL